MEETYLKPARLVESDAPEVKNFARYAALGAQNDIHKAVKLYNAVRDHIVYNPYQKLTDESSFSGKKALEQKHGFCTPKAALLVACARAENIPARLGFADVKNHLASPRLIKAAGGDVFYWHSYCELFLDGKWVKATPAFDRNLCQRAGLTPLEFDGRYDSIFHPFDNNRRHMEYVNSHGVFAGVPYEDIIATWKRFSPGLLEEEYAAARASFSDDLET